MMIVSFTNTYGLLTWKPLTGILKSDGVSVDEILLIRDDGVPPGAKAVIFLV